MTRGLLGAALIAASITAAPAGAATYSYIVGFGANYSGGFPGFSGSLSGGFGINDSRSVTQNFGGVSTEVRGSTRAGIVGGQPSLGFSLSSGPADGSVGASFSAGASVAFFDGLLLATPTRPNALPASLQFNLRTSVSGSIAGGNAFGFVTPAAGRVGASLVTTLDGRLFDNALSRVQNSGTVARSRTTFETFNQTLTFSSAPATLPDLVVVGSGPNERVLTRTEWNASYRRALEDCGRRARETNSQCAVKSPLLRDYELLTVGIGAAFGGRFADELQTNFEILASNSLNVEGLFVTDADTGEVIPFWIGGLSGVDYTLSEYAPEGLSPFAAEPVAPIPLPAAGWMLLAGLGMLAAVRKRGA